MEFDLSLRSLLKLLILPPGGLILMMLLGWALGRRLLGRLLLFCGFCGVYLITLPATSSWLARQIETIPAVLPQTLLTQDAQAILVFMADHRQHNPEFDGAAALSTMSLQRLDYALYLHRQTGLPLILSGGAIADDSRPLAELGRQWLVQQAGVQPQAIDTESKTTWQNGRFSARLLEEQGLKRVALVTHAFHMPRALYSAQTNDIDAIPAPFGFIHRSGKFKQPAEVKDWLPHAWPVSINYLLLHEALGQRWYHWIES